MPKLLAKKSIEFVRVDGRVTGDERMWNVKRFNDQSSNVKVMLLCAKAGSTGLNLIGARKMIMFEPDWNPKNDA